MNEAPHDLQIETNSSYKVIAFEQPVIESDEQLQQSHHPKKTALREN